MRIEVLFRQQRWSQWQPTLIVCLDRLILNFKPNVYSESPAQDVVLNVRPNFVHRDSADSRF